MTGAFDASKVEEIWLEARLSKEILDTLNARQKVAIAQAMRKAAWEDLPVDARFNIPFFKSRYFLAILGGKDSRDRERIKAEKAAHPVQTPGNIVFAFVAAAVFAGLTVFGSLLYSGIIVPVFEGLPFAAMYLINIASVVTCSWVLVFFAMRARKKKDGVPYNTLLLKLIAGLAIFFWLMSLVPYFTY